MEFHPAPGLQGWQVGVNRKEKDRKALDREDQALLQNKTQLIPNFSGIQGPENIL